VEDVLSCQVLLPLFREYLHYALRGNIPVLLLIRRYGRLLEKLLAGCCKELFRTCIGVELLFCGCATPTLGLVQKLRHAHILSSARLLANWHVN
jgi:hypothetical protein